MIEDGMFRIEASGFRELHDLAEAIITTKTAVNKKGDEIPTPETLAAKALQKQIELAQENGTGHLLFTEQEVLFLAAVV